MKLWNPFRSVKRILPHGLFWRSLIIVVAPMVILQGIVTYAFFVRHQDLMTLQMARGAASDVAFLIDIVNHNPSGPGRDNLLAMAAKNLEYRVSFAPGQQFAHPGRDRFTPHLKDAMNRVFLTQFGTHFPFHANFSGTNVNLEVQLKDGILALRYSAETADGHERLDLRRLDGDLIAAPARRCDSLLAQSGAAYRTAGLRGGSLRQGTCGAELQALWRNGSPPRGTGLHHHARAH